MGGTWKAEKLGHTKKPSLIVMKYADCFGLPFQLKKTVKGRFGESIRVLEILSMNQHTCICMCLSICIYIYKEMETYFRELAQTVVGSGKYKVSKADQGVDLMQTFSSNPSTTRWHHPSCLDKSTFSLQDFKWWGEVYIHYETYLL